MLKNPRFRRLSILFIAALIIDLCAGCCDCDESTELGYSQCELELGLIDNSGQEPTLSAADSIPLAAFGIELQVTPSEQLCHRPRIPSILSQSAYATSCDCPPPVSYLPLENLSSLQVITLEDFDAEHPANSDVSDSFFDLESVTEVLPGFARPDEFPRFDSNIPTDSYAWRSLLLRNGQGQPGVHRFRVEVQLSDGRTLTAETNPIILY